MPRTSGWPDVPDMGSSVYVVTDSDLALAQQLADELGDWLFARRADWHYDFPSTAEALRAAQAADAFPAIFADWTDNAMAARGPIAPACCAPLSRLASMTPGCCISSTPTRSRSARRLASARRSRWMSAASRHPCRGQPVRMQAEVVALSDGHFHYDGPMYAGLEGSMGPSAHIRQAGVHVLLVTQREQPLRHSLRAHARARPAPDALYRRQVGRAFPRQLRAMGRVDRAGLRAERPQLYDRRAALPPAGAPAVPDRFVTR